jgi:hypothetical protein
MNHLSPSLSLSVFFSLPLPLPLPPSLLLTHAPLPSDDGLAWLSKTFQLCQPLKSASELTDWLQETWFNMAMGKCVC